MLETADINSLEGTRTFEGVERSCGHCGHLPSSVKLPIVALPLVPRAEGLGTSQWCNLPGRRAQKQLVRQSNIGFFAKSDRRKHCCGFFGRAYACRCKSVPHLMAFL